MVLGITFLVFFIMSFSPIDPAYNALGEGASQEALDKYREEYGLNQPLLVRYASFLWGLLHADLGTYTSQRLPVSDRIGQAFPTTISLTFYGLIIAVVFALIFGVLAALYRDRWVDQVIRVVRTSMVEELDKDYVRTALGAGLPKLVVVARNVLRNALITPVTVLGLRIGYLMGGAVIIEVIFALPGMGQAILEGIQQNEPYLVQGVTLVVALAFVIINIVVDMLYILINPRIRTV